MKKGLTENLKGWQKEPLSCSVQEKLTHLAQMIEDDFYDRLLMEARRLRQMELISE